MSKAQVKSSIITEPSVTLSAGQRVGKQAVRIANSAVNAIVLVVIMLLLSFGIYALWDSDQVHRAAAANNYAIYKPVPEAKSFDELLAINSDVFAWIEVYGTHIDYPVVQGKDNMRYINTNAEGKYSLSGSIFLDYKNARDFSDFANILYGHHMEKEAMFGEVGNFARKSYFDARQYGMLFYNGREHGLEFFAFIHVDAYDKTVFRAGITEVSASQEYLNHILGLAIHTREIGVSAADRIVLLNTCSSSSTNGRDILVGRITDEVFENTFAQESDDGFADEGASSFLDLWFNLPFWGKVLVVILPLIALVLLVSYLVRRSRAKKSAQQNGPGARAMENSIKNGAENDVRNDARNTSENNIENDGKNGERNDENSDVKNDASSDMKNGASVKTSADLADKPWVRLNKGDKPGDRLSAKSTDEGKTGMQGENNESQLSEGDMPETLGQGEGDR